ncbi:hypothetical protein LZL87_012956 [Fusarium oxysporum]|nr:hypothetical protein LZL87_012956 [Fusarium oxysporum]
MPKKARTDLLTPKWCGSDLHIINDEKWYRDGAWAELEETVPIITGGGTVYPTATGTALITLHNGSNTNTISLTHTVLVKDFPLNIFSGEKLYLARGYIQENSIINQSDDVITTIYIKATTGGIQPAQLITTACDPCELAKSTRYTPKDTLLRATRSLQRLHFDLCKFKPVTPEGYRIAIPANDDNHLGLKTPRGVLYNNYIPGGNNPSISHLQTLGCKAVVDIEPEKRVNSEKAIARGWEGILVGYQGKHLQKIWNSKEKKVVITSHVVFHEKIPLYADHDVVRSRPPGAFKNKHSPERFETRQMDSDSGNEATVMLSQRRGDPSTLAAALAQDDVPEWREVFYSKIKIILAFSVQQGCKTQADVITAYLRKDLNEDIYMRYFELLLDFLNDPCYAHYAQRFAFTKDSVILSRQAIYGIKQSERQWQK